MLAPGDIEFIDSQPGRIEKIHRRPAAGARHRRHRQLQRQAALELGVREAGDGGAKKREVGHGAPPSAVVMYARPIGVSMTRTANR